MLFRSVLAAAVPLLTRVRLDAPRTAAVLALVAAPLLLAIPFVDAGGDDARLGSVGAAQVEQGEWYSDDFAAAARLLVSEAGGYINGQMIQVNGGGAT